MSALDDTFRELEATRKAARQMLAALEQAETALEMAAPAICTDQGIAAACNLAYRNICAAIVATKAIGIRT